MKKIFGIVMAAFILAVFACAPGFAVEKKADAAASKEEKATGKKKDKKTDVKADKKTEKKDEKKAEKKDAKKPADKKAAAAPTPAAAPAATTAAPAADKNAAAKSAKTETAKSDIIDINTATKEQLMTLTGIGDAFAQKIISGRPYKMKTQLKGKVLPAATYDKIADRIIAKQAKK